MSLESEEPNPHSVRCERTPTRGSMQGLPDEIDHPLQISQKQRGKMGSEAPCNMASPP